jgi:hypothetical protein
MGYGSRNGSCDVAKIEDILQKSSLSINKNCWLTIQRGMRQRSARLWGDYGRSIGLALPFDLPFALPCRA